MLFNSIEFLIFLPTVFLLYWFVFPSHLRLQNLFLLLVSYIFYGWWDWRFLFLIFFSSAIDYSVGLALEKTEDLRRRKGLLILSCVANLGILGYFKYYNFFLDSFIDAFGSLGFNLHRTSLQIILPAGISFYTFQTLSYTIDTYRKRIKPTKDVIAFFGFVAFFPQLVAGPIERASKLLPQFKKKRTFVPALATEGLQQMLWGFFKKMVIADNCALFVNRVFEFPEQFSAPALILGFIFFGIQIYTDFSGYSDIAIGTAKLFGFRLSRNFAYPYFASNIAQFWQRWHISLVTWFRDYVLRPLGRGKKSKWVQFRNIFIVFVLIGLWHGANWTFLVWGALNALYFLPLVLRSGKRKKSLLKMTALDPHPSIKKIGGIIGTFLLISFTGIFFRAQSLGEAFVYIEKIFTWNKGYYTIPYMILPFILGAVLMEFWRRKTDCPLYILGRMSVPLRFLVYCALFFTIVLMTPNETNSFIYFQF